MQKPMSSGPELPCLHSIHLWEQSVADTQRSGMRTHSGRDFGGPRVPPALLEISSHVSQRVPSGQTPSRHGSPGSFSGGEDAHAKGSAAVASTNLTRCEIRRRKNSDQSRPNSIFTEPTPPQFCHRRHAFREAHARNVLAIQRVRFFEACCHADSALHLPGIVPWWFSYRRRRTGASTPRCGSGELRDVRPAPWGNRAGRERGPGRVQGAGARHSQEAGAVVGAAVATCQGAVVVGARRGPGRPVRAPRRR